jgi:hypothetical protein
LKIGTMIGATMIMKIRTMKGETMIMKRKSNTFPELVYISGHPPILGKPHPAKKGPQHPVASSLDSGRQYITGQLPSLAEELHEG